eukprot:755882-Hanusia_phi.AAC.3
MRWGHHHGKHWGGAGWAGQSIQPGSDMRGGGPGDERSSEPYLSVQGESSSSVGGVRWRNVARRVCGRDGGEGRAWPRRKREREKRGRGATGRTGGGDEEGNERKGGMSSKKEEEGAVRDKFPGLPWMNPDVGRVGHGLAGRSEVSQRRR